MFDFLRSSRLRVLSALLFLQAAVFYGFSRPEPVRIVQHLADFPKTFGSWRMIQEGSLEKEEMEILRADEAITRYYGSPEIDASANLFIAYFTTQRTGKAPHSPKNCLPGAGWLPLVNDKIYIPVQGRQDPVEANRFVVARGQQKSLVLYWYQTQRRTVADEYKAKVFTVLDAIRYNRSDAAVVKVTVPVRDDQVDLATENGKKFVQAFFHELDPYFPPA